MSVIDRLVSFFAGIIVLLLSVLLLIYAVPVDHIVNQVGTSIEYFTGSLEIGIAGIILLLFALRAFWGAFKTEKPEQSVNQSTDIGEVKISLQTLESMVLRVAQNEVKGIKEVKSNIKVAENGVIIYLRGKVLADLELPQVSEQLQKAVKENIENQAGINVTEVKVLVENITTEASRPAK